MSDDVTAELVSWNARVTGTAEVRDNGVFKGFVVKLTYEAMGTKKDIEFTMDTETEARHFLIGNEITICLEARA